MATLKEPKWAKRSGKTFQVTFNREATPLEKECVDSLGLQIHKYRKAIADLQRERTTIKRRVYQRWYYRTFGRKR